MAILNLSSLGSWEYEGMPIMLAFSEKQGLKASASGYAIASMEGLPAALVGQAVTVDVVQKVQKRWKIELASVRKDDEGKIAHLSFSFAPAVKLKNKVEKLSKDPPDFVCVISHDLMNDPAFASDQYTYDRPSILRHLNSSYGKKSPLSGEPFVTNVLLTNRNLKSQIEKYKDQTSEKCIKLAEECLLFHDARTAEALIKRLESLSPNHPRLHQLQLDLSRAKGEKVEDKMVEEKSKAVTSDAPAQNVAQAAASSSVSVAQASPTRLTDREIWKGNRLQLCVLQLAGGLIAHGDGKKIHVRNLTGDCLKTFEGHTNDIRSLFQLADGSLVSGSDDGYIKIWNLQTGECLKTIKVCDVWVFCLLQLRDGSLVCNGNDCTFCIWDLQTGRCVKTLKGHRDCPHSLLELGDGLLASGGGWTDATIKIWDLQSGNCLQTLQGHQKNIDSLVRLPDGSLASASEDATIRIWNRQTGRCLRVLTGHRSGVRCLIPLADGTLVSGSSDCTIRIWNPQTGHCLKTFEGIDSSHMALLTDGSLVVAGTFGRLSICKIE